MQDFHKLLVWREVHAFVLAVYRQTATFPGEERFGLVSQMRRAATSVPANLAEGCGRSSDADFARFVQIAMGSASEVNYHLLLALDLGYISESKYDEFTKKLGHIKAMLINLLKKLRT